MIFKGSREACRVKPSRRPLDSRIVNFPVGWPRVGLQTPAHTSSLPARGRRPGNFALYPKLCIFVKGGPTRLLPPASSFGIWTPGPVTPFPAPRSDLAPDFQVRCSHGPAPQLSARPLQTARLTRSQGPATATNINDGPEMTQMPRLRGLNPKSLTFSPNLTISPQIWQALR